MERLRKLREEKNLTQQQLADKLYVSRQTICRWEPHMFDMRAVQMSLVLKI